MLGILLSFNWINIILIVFTCFSVANDRAFAKKVRSEFHYALVCSFIVVVVSQHLKLPNVSPGSFTENFVLNTNIILRPIILLLLIFATQYLNKVLSILLYFPLVLNLVFMVLGMNAWNAAIFSFYIIIFALVISLSSKKDDKSNYIFAGTMLTVNVIAMVTEAISKNYGIVNMALSTTACLYYFYCVMCTYKRDGLTGLLMRHNLNYEMKDLANKDYDIALIDVDNFKLINDKYGHDKGDEALVTIVDTVSKHLLKGCRLYRFGGDEFVIISRKASSEELIAALDEANDELALSDLHMSFGVVMHHAGEDSAEVLNEADKVMYANKRRLKSEDIWDDMTGLYNYRGFLDEMDTLRKAVEKDGECICLLGIDVEHLTNINMAYGYTEGNLVISTLARVLKTCLRNRDFIGHVGSDEFVVALECKKPDTSYAYEFLNELQEGLDSAYEFADKDYSVKLNIGKYLVENDNDLSSEECINNVLYVKQEDKENRRKSSSDDKGQDYNNQDEELVMDILDNNKLKYAFQPIVSSKDGSIVAYEALMRSDTETKISPLKILKYAERNKRTYDVEKYTFYNTLAAVSASDNFPKDAKIFINSIPGHFLTENDYDQLKSKYGKLFEKMVVEITEQREIEDDAFGPLNMKRDKDGFQIAIDDYGSGCSNTNSLLRYMPQVVKLDRLLISGIDRNAKKQFFVNSIISFAKDNDMQVLAEGVETESELKTVIRLGVDLIQGYITARPSFDIVSKISDNIKKLIVDENLKVGSNQRVAYTASSNCELSVFNLAMEDYSKINISAEYVTLTGSSEYTSDMVLRIKEGIKCHLTLSDVKLNSIDDEPCIDVGENTELILNLEGNNRLNAKGIHVPASSSLTVIGAGNIEIYVKGHECYAIGSDTESGFGKLIFKNSGHVDINVDGEECAGIGGGIASEDSAIDISAGSFNMNVAGVNAVAVGCYKGNIPINIINCEIMCNFRVNTGIVIGTMDGKQDVHIKNYNIVISGSGTEISGIGSIKETEGLIDIESGTYQVKLNGHKIYLIGAESGNLDIRIAHSRLEMVGEGNNVLGFGTFDENAALAIVESSLALTINAASPLGIGVSKNNTVFKGPLATMTINGESVSLQEVDE